MLGRGLRRSLVQFRGGFPPSTPSTSSLLRYPLPQSFFPLEPQRFQTELLEKNILGRTTTTQNNNILNDKEEEEEESWMLSSTLKKRRLAMNKHKRRKRRKRDRRKNKV